VRQIFPPADCPPGQTGPADLTRRDLAEIYAYPSPDGAAATAAPAPATAAAATAAPAPAARAWVRANMVTSTDGASTIRGRSHDLSSDADRSLFALLRTLSDVILVGAGTVRAERYAAVRPDELWPGLRDGDSPAVPAIAVVTRRVSLDLSTPLLTAALPGARTIIITTEQAPAELRAEAARNADVIVAGDDTADLGFALDELAKRGFRRVLAEGGPQLLGQLAAAELLDELCLTISPLVASGAAGRIAVGSSAVQAGKLVLQHVIEDKGYLFTRYTRRRPAIA
jgi:riboflavin biosynthesis pyrimidine reductase